MTLAPSTTAPLEQRTASAAALDAARVPDSTRSVLEDLARGAHHVAAALVRRDGSPVAMAGQAGGDGRTVAALTATAYSAMSLVLEEVHGSAMRVIVAEGSDRWLVATGVTEQLLFVLVVAKPGSLTAAIEKARQGAHRLAQIRSAPSAPGNGSRSSIPRLPSPRTS